MLGTPKARELASAVLGTEGAKLPNTAMIYSMRVARAKREGAEEYQTHAAFCLSGTFCCLVK